VKYYYKVLYIRVSILQFIRTMYRQTHIIIVVVVDVVYYARSSTNKTNKHT